VDLLHSRGDADVEDQKELYFGIRSLLYDYGCEQVSLLLSFLCLSSAAVPATTHLRPLGVFMYRRSKEEEQEQDGACGGYIYVEPEEHRSKWRAEPSMTSRSVFAPQAEVRMVGESAHAVECHGHNTRQDCVLLYIKDQETVFVIPCLLLGKEVDKALHLDMNMTTSPPLVAGGHVRQQQQQQQQQQQLCLGIREPAVCPSLSSSSSSESLSAALPSPMGRSSPEFEMTYEKRIELLACSQQVKNKAFDRLREFAAKTMQNTYVIPMNLTESQTKARQYVDALLRIPFGQYRIEYICSTFQITMAHIIPCCKLLSNYSIPLNRLARMSEEAVQQLNVITVSHYLCQLKPDEVRACIPADATELLEALDCICTYWQKYLDQQSEYFQNIQETLDAVVYDTLPAKENLKSIVAQWINGENKGYILGLHGPPGIGKTTLIEHGLAHCLKDEHGAPKPYVFISLCGLANANVLKGHSYTYMASAYGAIAAALIESKCMNPILCFDELDKVSQTEHAQEVINILIQMTDPAQNTKFIDYYFGPEVALDLSRCLIVFTFNDKQSIHPVLLERIHCIELDPIPKHNKLVIAKEHLIPRCMAETGMFAQGCCPRFTDEVLLFLIERYTDEAGVRQLYKVLLYIFRHTLLRALLAAHGRPCAAEVVKSEQGEEEFTCEAIRSILEHMPQTRSFYCHQHHRGSITSAASARVGIVNGLTVHENGRGTILQFEAAWMYTKGLLEHKATGSQGQLLRESVEVAKTLALRLIPDTILVQWVTPVSHETECYKGFHIHCPKGAIQKDGPSAGAAITVALLSVMTGFPVLQSVAITGEIRQNGDVTEVGGMLGKILAADNCGITKLICPEENQHELEYYVSRGFLKKEEVGQYLLANSALVIYTVNTIYEVLDHALVFPEGGPLGHARSFFNTIAHYH
jgi:ATP-dependent Lon protease